MFSESEWRGHTESEGSTRPQSAGATLSADMVENGNELLRERKRAVKLLGGGTQNSARNRVSRIERRFDVTERVDDGVSSGQLERAADAHVDVKVSAATFCVGPNGTVVV